MEQRIKENERKLKKLDDFIKYMENKHDIKLLKYQKEALRLLTLADAYSIECSCKRNPKINLLQEDDEFM